MSLRIPMVESKKICFRPQGGPQENFLSTSADIGIYGGSAGGGKTWSLVYEPLRHIGNPFFNAIIFRKTSVQIRNPGGLWNESNQLYPYFQARPRESYLEWVFPTGVTFKFGHLEYEKDVLNFQGAQINYLGFDELTHFSENQFFYMMSRNRSISGIPGYIRATCNPDPDSWVRQFIDWWIGPDGYPIPERSGKLRYFIRINGALVWANSKEEIYQTYGKSSEIRPKSVTFIPAKLEDNQILMHKDPNYLSNLLSLSYVDRLRLRDGNWNIRHNSGTLFKREWFPILDVVPSGWIQAIRFWDRAATRPHEGNKDPDWTRGLKLYKYADGTFCVVDLKSSRDTPGQIEKLVQTVAQHDTLSVTIMSQQDPGSAGVAEADYFVKMLQGYHVRVMTTSKDKLTRAKPVSAQAERGNIKVLRAPWNHEFFHELESFPEGNHDDIVDVLSGSFNEMAGGFSILDVL